MFKKMAQAYVPGVKKLKCDVIKGGDELLCKKCLCVLCNPEKLTCCDHNLCRTCVAEIKIKKCPFCKSDHLNAKPNKDLLCRINGLRVHCPHSECGCAWEGELIEVAGHVAVNGGSNGDCQYQKVRCRNLKCESIVFRKDLFHHENNACKFRQYRCEHCFDFEATYEDVSTHHFPECPEFPVPCPNGCECKPMPRSSVKEHCSTECLLQEVPCDYYLAGCDLFQARKNTESHNKEYLVQHSSLLAKQNAILQTKLTETLQKLSQQQKEQSRFHSLVQQVVHQQAEQELHFQARYDELVQEHSKHESKFLALLCKQEEEQQKQISSLKAELEEAKKKATGSHKELKGDIAELKDTVSSNSREVNQEMQEVKAKAKSSSLAMNKEIKESKTAASSSTLDISKELKSVKSKMSAMENFFTQVYKELQYVERCVSPVPPCSYSVSILPEPERKVFLSPAFYTHLRGYKLCMQVDLRGPNVVLTCCVMKGEHDDTLAWPFRGIVHVSIMTLTRSKKTIINCTDGAVKPSKLSIGHLEGYKSVIPHKELDLSIDEKDSLNFTVNKVDVRS